MGFVFFNYLGDLFHFGHVQALEHAKLKFENVWFIVGGIFLFYIFYSIFVKYYSFYIL